MTTDKELCDALRGWTATNFPAQPVPIPPADSPPQPSAYPTKEFFCGHIQAPKRLGDNPPKKYQLQFDMVRMLGIWSCGDGGTPIQDQPATHYEWVCWSTINPANGQYNWKGFDKYVTTMGEYGITKMVVPLHSPPAWTGPQGPSGTNPSPTATRDFVSAVLRRAPGLVKAFEGYNEFNVGNSAGFAGSAAQLVAVQKAMYEAVKAIDATVPVLSPTLTNAQNLPAGYPPNQGVLPLKPFLDAGGAQYCDGIAVHVYPYKVSPPDSYAAQIDRVVKNTSDLFAQYGKAGLPVWMTEGAVFPEDSITDATEAANYMKMYLDRMIANKVAKCFWYCWDNNNRSALWAQSGNLTAFGTAQQTYRQALGV